MALEHSVVTQHSHEARDTGDCSETLRDAAEKTHTDLSLCYCYLL